MDFSSRYDRLMEIAQEDDIFQVYAKSQAIFKEPFHRFIRWMPKKLRNILAGYAYAGVQMHQRIITIACEQMRFPDENAE